jgi:hypothetical protein
MNSALAGQCDTQLKLDFNEALNLLDFGNNNMEQLSVRFIILRGLERLTNKSDVCVLRKHF